ncbi:MAG: GNAT family N-acetyltransferase [Theionarchaea archaeon]|nr:GNAT family N-acetyltransferase [Theionarchaea archaeon]
MDIQTSHTIQSVTESEWTSLVGTSTIEQSYRWFRAVEDSRIRDMVYGFIREEGSLKAATCGFCDAFRVGGVTIPLLEIGSPLGMSACFFSSSEQHTIALLDTLTQIQQSKKCRGIMILDLSEQQVSYLNQHVEGYVQCPPYDNTYIDLNFSDFDDYLESLPSNARRSVRITMNRAEKKWRLRLNSTNEFTRWKEVTRRLQGYVCEEHHNFRWHLPLTFYDALETHLKNDAELLICFTDDIPIVYGLALNTPETCQYKFVGIDPAYRHYHAYFLLYYEGIKRAIERGQSRIYFGTSNYEFKEKIGCLRESLHGLVRLQNPVFNTMVRCYVTGMKIMGKTVEFT